MNSYDELAQNLKESPRTWLVTGVAGFIGSNIAEELLQLNQKVVGLDNFSTGFQKNLEDIKEASGSLWENFHFIEGDIRDYDTCLKATEDVDLVLHQAALGSVPRSINNPMLTNANNVDGTLNVMFAAKENKVKRVVYASSSSVYGDDDRTPKLEENVGKPLSPYAISKKTCEYYGRNFHDVYGLETVGLRYFNVFGKRQNPNGPYAAVIPKWIDAFVKGDVLFINGDGSTSRDFTYVENVIQLNLLAATSEKEGVAGNVFNGALGATTSLLELYGFLEENLKAQDYAIAGGKPEMRDFRKGDIMHSFANIDKASSLLSYQPSIPIGQGLKLTIDWFLNNKDFL